MTFRRTVASNLVIQTLGPVSSFLTVFAIARMAGPSMQGHFAQLKSWVDLLVAIGCFGFPQSFLYVVNRLGASATALARWSAWYTVALFPPALLASYLAIRMKVFESAAGTRTLLPLTCAAAALILHGLWRGLYLTRELGPRFALFSILPATTLLAAVTLGLLAGSNRFASLILVSAIACLCASGLLMAPILRSPRTGRYRDEPWGPLLTNGLHSFLQATFVALQPVVAYWLVRLGAGSDREIGFFNLGLFLVQGLAVPITMVSPLLFARWTSQVDAGLVERLDSWTIRAAAVAVLAGILLALPVPWVLPVVFGGDYQDAVRIVQALLVTVPVLLYARMVAPAPHARGRPGINTFAYGSRLAVFTAAGLLLRGGGHGSLALALAWTGAEVVAAGLTFGGLRMAADQARDGGRWRLGS